ncbi:MAG: hypothetical protein M1836_001208 [Candelina mexicana]|nr:MAG: hypothetical protein M1836_001208 [Candelina mexicana]
MCHEILTEFKTCGHTVPFLETCATYLTTSNICGTLSEAETLPPQDGYCFDCLQKQSDEEAIQRGAARAGQPKLFYKSRTTYKNCGHSDVADMNIERDEADPEFIEMEEKGQCWDCAKIPQSELEQMRKLAGLSVGGAKEGETLVFAGGSGGNGANTRAKNYRSEMRNAFDDAEEEPHYGAGRMQSPEIDESSRKGKGRAVSSDFDQSDYKGKGKAYDPESHSPSPAVPMHEGPGTARPTSQAQSEYSESDSDSEAGGLGYGKAHTGDKHGYPDVEEDDVHYQVGGHVKGFPHGRTPPPQRAPGGRRHEASDRDPMDAEYHSGDEEGMHNSRGPPRWGRNGQMHPLERQTVKCGKARETGDQLPGYSDDDGEGDEGKDIRKL